MHFLDNIFPLQYPVYKPGVLEGGRGWLLPLISSTHPLYHAALAFGAYYRAVTLPSTSQSSRVAASVEQGKHFEVCIKEINLFTQRGCQYNKLGIITTIIQLVFYEVCFNF